MVEKLDVAFDACDANTEGAMMHGFPRLLNAIRRGMRLVPIGSDVRSWGNDRELTCTWGTAGAIKYA